MQALLQLCSIGPAGTTRRLLLSESLSCDVHMNVHASGMI